MFVVDCMKCGNPLMLDEISTRDEYLKDMAYMVDEEGRLIEDTIQQYLIYRCQGCNSTYKLTYKEWEKLFRLKVAWEVMQLRKAKMFRQEVNMLLVNPDNGIEFCGQCDGVDKEGNCYKDVIKQCTIRGRLHVL